MPIIIFEKETEFGTYRDSITLPEDHIFTDLEIENMKSERVSNWVSHIQETSQNTQLSQTIENVEKQ